MNCETGTVYWITGLSGAGKTTIGKLLYEKIRIKKPNVFMLDGDIGRKAYNDMIGYTIKEREEGAYRNARVCKMIASQGIDVVCCTVSMFDAVRDWNRKNVPNYIEIFLDVPIDVLINRDSKGLYAKARHGEERDVWGLDITPELPAAPHIRFINDGHATPEEVLTQILLEIKALRQHPDNVSSIAK